MIGKLWLDKISIGSAISFTGHSSNIIGTIWQNFRQPVASTLEVVDAIIGGDGVMVSIGDKKLGRSNITESTVSKECGPWLL